MGDLIDSIRRPIVKSLTKALRRPLNPKGSGIPGLALYDDLLGGFVVDDLNNNQTVVEG